MTPHRPYLLRALYEWILDNDCTPYVLVNALADDVQVPQDFVKDGQIVLNISPTAVHGLLVDNEALSFNARFGGVPMLVYVPVMAVMGIYARENGQGMMFETAAPGSPPPEGEPGGKPDSNKASSQPKEKGAKSARPRLRVVK